MYKYLAIKRCAISLGLVISISNADIKDSFDNINKSEVKLDSTIKEFIVVQEIEHKISGNNIVNQKEINFYLDSLKNSITIEENSDD